MNTKAQEILARLKSLRAAKSEGKTVAPGGLTISESVYQPPPKGGKPQPSVATIVVENANVDGQVLRRFTFGAKRAEDVYSANIDGAIAFAETTVDEAHPNGLTIQGFTLNQLKVLRDHAEAVLERVASLAERGLKSAE